MSTLKGLLVFVYRKNGTDSTNGGISSQYDRLIVVGNDVPQVFEARENCPAVEIVTKGGYKKAVPVSGEGKWWMNGGNFLYSCDQTFREMFGDQPIAIHDRCE